MKKLGVTVISLVAVSLIVFPISGIAGTYQELLAEEARLPIPRPRSHTVDEVGEMLRQRAALAQKFKKALDTGSITQEQYDELMKRNQRHALGYE